MPTPSSMSDEEWDSPDLHQFSLDQLIYHSVTYGTTTDLVHAMFVGDFIQRPLLAVLLVAVQITPYSLLPILAFGAWSFLRGGPEERLAVFMLGVIEDFLHLVRKYRQTEYAAYLTHLLEEVQESKQLLRDISRYLHHMDMPVTEAQQYEWYQNVQKYLSDLEKFSAQSS